MNNENNSENKEITREISTLISESRKKQRNSIIYTSLFILLVITIAIVVSINIFFNIKTINVAGLTKYTMEEVIETSNIKIGQNIFDIDKSEIEKNIYQKYPYFSSVTIKRLYPNSIDIIVDETKDRLLFLNDENSYTLVGENRRILKTCSGTFTGNIPKLVGIDLSYLPLGYELTEGHVKQIEQLIRNEKDEAIESELEKEMYNLIKMNTYIDTIDRILGAIEENEIQNICYYDISDGISLTMFYDYRIIAKMGSELNLEYKLKFFKEVLERLGTQFKGTVNMESFAVNKKTYTRQEPIGKYIHPSFKLRYY